MAQSDASLRHHLDEVTEAQFKCDVPSHTQNDDLLVKMPSLEQILCRGRFLHPGSYRTIPSLSTVCTRTKPGVGFLYSCEVRPLFAVPTDDSPLELVIEGWQIYVEQFADGDWRPVHS